MLHASIENDEQPVYLFCIICAKKQRMLTREDMNRDMRFPTMWYVRPAKPQISLRMSAV